MAKIKNVVPMITGIIWSSRRAVYWPTHALTLVAVAVTLIFAILFTAMSGAAVAGRKLNGIRLGEKPGLHLDGLARQDRRRHQP